jgi:dTDP-4-dehydrorhamnose reductase
VKRLTLVLGAGGQLGQAMAAELPARHEVVTLTRADVDVTSDAALTRAVTAICPDIIINCAAFTAVDDAERVPAEALAVNAWSVRTLARLASDLDATLVHYSTDFVFDGETGRPYTEDDEPNPRSAYAASKLVGEWLAAEAPRAYVLRVESLFGGPKTRSSVDRLLAGIRAGTPVRAFSDRTVSPSYVNDVVRATDRLIDDEAPCGVYHCVNSGWATWVDVARELARLAGCPDATIVETAAADAGLVAPRPRFAALSNAKLAAAGIPMPTWQDALARHVTASSAE